MLHCRIGSPIVFNIMTFAVDRRPSGPPCIVLTSYSFSTLHLFLSSMRELDLESIEDTGIASRYDQ